MKQSPLKSGDCHQLPKSEPANQGMEPTGRSARLMPSVDMTSDVKGGEQLFLHLPPVFSFVYRKSRSQSDTTVDHADIRGLATT